MKKIISIILLLSSLSLSAQRVAYCELDAGNFWGGRNVYVILDLGSYGYGSFVDEQGRARKFSGIIGALNHMASLGWRVLTVYPLTENKKIYLHYLLEKTITSESQITEGIYIKERERGTKPKKEKPSLGSTRDDIY